MGKLIMFLIKTIKCIACTTFVMLMLNACSTTCSCCKNAGCTILTVVSLPQGDTVAIRSFCSETNMFSKAIQDSIQEFRKNLQDIYGKDIDFHEYVALEQDCMNDLTEEEANHYHSLDYYCECAK